LTIQTPATARIRRSPAARVHAFTKMAHHEANAVQIGAERPAAYARFTASGSLLVHKDGAPHTISHFVLAYERAAGLAGNAPYPTPIPVGTPSHTTHSASAKPGNPGQPGVAQPSLEV
jgi:hypothetical protein